MKDNRRLIGSSAVTEELLSSISKIAPSDAPILIRGPTGVGKELVAREIHRLSGREGRGRFVAVNCSAIPTELLESELFGHAKGAFSGAVSSYEGRMRLADCGSLLLDEIGDMPSELQAKLLRAVQEGVVTPVGSPEEISVDVRIISATHKPLEKLIEAGSFREDLFFRLNVIPISVLPLRERPDEILELFDYFSEAYSLENEPIRLHARSVGLLQSYPWPGNVRELENFCRRLSALYPGETISLYDLPKAFLPLGMAHLISGDSIEGTKIDPVANIEAAPELPVNEDVVKTEGEITDSDEDGIDRVLNLAAMEQSIVATDETLSLKQRVSKFERKIIEKAISDAGGNISEASRVLGVKRTTLIEKMSRLDIARS